MATPGSKNAPLQALRFLAAALVLATHITFYLHERIDPSVAIWHPGEIGVPIFFVISGYVMSVSSRKLPADLQGARVFLTHRLTRVFPMYWLLTALKLASLWLVPWAVLHSRPDALDTLASLVLFPVFNAEGQIRPVHGVGWTLLHEMWFYGLFALGLALKLPPARFSGLVIGVAWVLGLLTTPQSAWGQVYTSGLNLLFVGGMACAHVLTAERVRGVPGWVCALGALVAVALWMGEDWGVAAWSGLWGQHVAAWLLVVAALCLPHSVASRVPQPLVSLGESSYTLYLVHPMAAPAILVVLAQWGVGGSAWLAPVAFLACVGVCHQVFRRVERPLNQAARSWVVAT